MSRARNIKPGFFKNPELAEVSYECRLLFIGLWTLCDREGYLEDLPKRIKMELFPADNADVESGLSDLAKHGFIQRYTVDGNGYIYVCKFLEHQHPHHLEKPSIIPKPGTSLGLFDTPPTQKPRQAPVKTEANPSDSLNPDSLIQKALADKPPKKRIQLPINFYPDETGVKKAEQAGISLAIELEAFTNHHRAHGKMMLDWQAAWRTWVGNAVKFASARPNIGYGAWKLDDAAIDAKAAEVGITIAGLTRPLAIAKIEQFMGARQ